jgi:hypothetical protein
MKLSRFRAAVELMLPVDLDSSLGNPTVRSLVAEARKLFEHGDDDELAEAIFSELACLKLGCASDAEPYCHDAVADSSIINDDTITKFAAIVESPALAALLRSPVSAGIASRPDMFPTLAELFARRAAIKDPSTSG